MVNRNLYRVVCQYKDNRGVLEEFVFDTILTTKTLSDDEALKQAKGLCLALLDGTAIVDNLPEPKYSFIHGKENIVGAYVQKGDYGASE